MGLVGDSRKCTNSDINTRYLALDGMAKLNKYSNGNKIMKDHPVLALNLLFLICIPETEKTICKKLLIYFIKDDHQLKEDITLKIAILT